MSNETFMDLVYQASGMLIDRSKEEADLIYHIAKLDDEERAAIILAYKTVFKN